MRFVPRTVKFTRLYRIENKSVKLNGLIYYMLLFS